MKGKSGQISAVHDDDNIIDRCMMGALSDYLNANPDVGIVGQKCFFCFVKYLNFQKINLYLGWTRGFVDDTNDNLCV